MATRGNYFNHTPSRVTEEQNVIEDLMIEQIQLWGTDVFYIPRGSLSTVDPLYGEDPTAAFNAAYSLEVYINNTTAPIGQSEFFSKFGLEIRDSASLVIARRTFAKYVPNLDRPNEGDLIYVPVLKNLFEIKFVEPDYDFRTLGRRAPLYYVYELQVEAFKYSNERFNTGVDEIDSIGQSYSYSIQYSMSPGGNGSYQIGETAYQGQTQFTANASGTVKSWTPANNVLSLINIRGSFSNANVTVIGGTSNARWTISSYDQTDYSGVLEQVADNKTVETEMLDFASFDPGNPFGNP